ncbi:MAG: glycosyltransferase family protein [Chitinophagia bacterium]
MNILYAVQGTGNGHISRAIQLYPFLKNYGNVDFFISGSNTDLKTDLPVIGRSKGISLFYKSTGGLDYLKIIQSFSFSIFMDAYKLPVNNYDLVINDFDFVTSLACLFRKKKSVQFGHQASFQSNKTPRSKSNNIVGEFILKNFVKSTHYLGLHFKAYDVHVYNPIIKQEIIEAIPTDEGHISVYLPHYSIAYLEPYFLAQSKYHFEVFSAEVTSIRNYKNIIYFPISNSGFTKSMIRSHAVITGGGFETPAEAMYMNKKVLSIPIAKHYEQLSNAAALTELGVKVILQIDQDFHPIFTEWINHTAPVKLELTHSTKEIVDQLIKQTQNS